MSVSELLLVSLRIYMDLLKVCEPGFSVRTLSSKMMCGVGVKYRKNHSEAWKSQNPGVVVSFCHLFGKGY